MVLLAKRLTEECSRCLCAFGEKKNAWQPHCLCWQLWMPRQRLEEETLCPYRKQREHLWQGSGDGQGKRYLSIQPLALQHLLPQLLYFCHLLFRRNVWQHQSIIKWWSCSTCNASRSLHTADAQLDAVQVGAWLWLCWEPGCWAAAGLATQPSPCAARLPLLKNTQTLSSLGQTCLTSCPCLGQVAWPISSYLFSNLPTEYVGPFEAWFQARLPLALTALCLPPLSEPPLR